MPKLKTLDLAGGSVTDRAIPNIVAIQGLTRLVAARNGISAAGVTELKRELRRLRVMTELE